MQDFIGMGVQSTFSKIVSVRTSCPWLHYNLIGLARSVLDAYFDIVAALSLGATERSASREYEIICRIQVVPKSASYAYNVNST